MRRDVLAVAAALAVQVLLVAAIPLHETFIRASGRTVFVAVEPIDPYDPMRGYHADFTYAGIDQMLPGFDPEAADGSSAWIVLRTTQPGGAARPVRVLRSPAAGHRDAVLRMRYTVHANCDVVLRAAGCRSLQATPDAWYADEATVTALAGILRKHQAVAELRVTADGDASLLRLRPSPPGMGPGR